MNNSFQQKPLIRRLLIGSLLAWAAFTTFAVVQGVLSEIHRDEQGLNRDIFDLYFEASLTGTRNFTETVAGLQPSMNVIAGCFLDTGGIDRFLGAEAKAKLESDSYFHEYDRADYVWRIVLIAEDQEFRSVYLAQYSEPGEDASQRGCYALSDIKLTVEPPSIKSGKPFPGSIRIN